MIIIIESVILCLLFTLMVYIMSKNPLKMLFDYPPKIQERVKKLDIYKDKIPKKQDKILIKSIFSIVAFFVFGLILKYINGYTTFQEGFVYSFLLWTIVNVYDLIVLDIIWFCHNPRFVIKGTEDMTKEYHNYLFHFKGFLTGELLALIVCAIVGLIIEFVL